MITHPRCDCGVRISYCGFDLATLFRDPNSVVELKRRGAELRERALAAERRAGLADLSTVRDEKVREDYPVGTRHERGEVALYLFGLLLRGEAEPFGEPCDVRVYDHAGGDSVGVAEYDVRRLSRDAGQFKQFLHRTGQAPA